MSWKTLIPFVVAIALGVVAVKLGRDLYQEGRTPRDTVKVVAATRDLDPGAEIRTGDVTLVDLPKAAVPATALMKPEEATGRVVATFIPKNMLLSDTDLAPVGASRGLPGLVPAGMRAVSIEVTESSGMTGLLVPECHVDVIGTLIDPQTRQPMARTIVEDVKVSAVGPRLAPRNKGGGEAEPPARTVTLLVTPRQAESIALMASKTRPWLVMRGTGDTTPGQSDGFAYPELFGATEPRAQAPATQPVATTQPAAPASLSSRIVVIRGGKETYMNVPKRLGASDETGQDEPSQAKEEQPASPGGDGRQRGSDDATGAASLH